MNTEKLTTIARPYATAAFEYALAKKDLAAWEIMLTQAAIIAQNDSMKKLLMSPQVTQTELADIFCGILANQLDAEKTNFIRLLSEYDRLEALPDIAHLFSVLCAQQEKTISVQVSSAVPLSDAQKKKMAEALSERLRLTVSLQCETDPDLLGGAIIRAGDTVIDGSIRGKLNRLLDFI